MKVVVLLLVLSATAEAGDFRAFDLGGSCEGIAASEAALGHSKAPWPALDGMEMEAFGGHVFGRMVTIGYLCSKGVLLSGNYYFSKGPLETALSDYEAVYSQLAKSYGAPYLDNSRWMQPVDSRWPEPDPAKYSTIWKTPRLWISISILPLLEDGQHYWQLAAMYLPPSEGARSNTSFERTRDR